MKRTLLFLYFLFLFFLLGNTSCFAKEKESDSMLKNWEDTIELDEMQDAFEKLQGTDSEFQVNDYVKGIVNGETKFSLRDLFQKGIVCFEEQFEKEKDTLFRILALGIVSGVVMNFSGSLGEKSLGETGFYIVYTVVFATVSTSFFMAFDVAEQAISNLLIFMKTLIPSFSLSLCYGGGTGTSLVFYETMLIAIGFIEMIMANFLLPGVKIYFLLSMINPLIDNHFSKMADLVRGILKGSVKILFGVLLGYQGIQGILLPVMDKVKGNSVIQTAKGLPGVGNTLGSAVDTIMGSGMLIKSAVGVGGIICIVVLCFYPLLKLIIYTLLYRIGGAFIQPVSDKRVSASLHVAAESGKILLWYLLAGVIMFMLAITIVLAATNII